ncbi:hypothetical protein [Phycicoccus sp. DTK01]|uniref:hypothetical protein n=1 Tax=Phycicoccus sp. DTK01 TaxID=2785745 RepID=UPI001A8FB494|nr:hypothetical protein [Phycicoccus sp. DTK01]GIL35742.1 hypothetical protein PDTK01_18170 [Phycicoccus sp. DTK01]
MVIPDEGPSNPALPADAGPNERRLYGIYGFSTVLVRMTADDWGTTADTVSNLATEVRSVITKLQGADRPWTGPAADGAYATLQQLARQLDRRAEEITGIKQGLTKAADAADTARQAYQNTVRTISTDVDRSSYERTQARQGGQPAPDGKVFDQAGFDAAVAAQREQREQQSATVLAAFSGEIGEAAKDMPVEAKESVTIDPGSSGGSGGGGGYPSGGGPSGGSYVAPSGGGGGVYHVSHPTGWVQEPVVENPQPPTPVPPVDPPVEPPAPVSPVSPTPTPVHLDGGTTGTVTPGGAGSTGWAGTSPAGGSVSGGAGGLGGAGAVGGGALMGGAALLGKGVLGRMGGGAFGAAGAAGRPGLVAGSTSAAGRGASGAAGRGAAGAAGRTTVAPGGQGAAARGGARGAGGGRGAAGVTGSRSTGKYGVPKVGESGGRGAGAKGAVGAASGGRGGRRGRDEQAQDVDHLTHEDEETWFEGEDDATPPVWR